MMVLEVWVTSSDAPIVTVATTNVTGTQLLVQTMAAFVYPT